MLGDDIFNLIRVEGKNRRIRLRLTFWQAQHNSIIAGHRLGIHAGALCNARANRQRPRGINPAAKRRVQHDAPVPQLIFKPLHHQRRVIRNRARGLILLVQKGAQVILRPRIGMGNQFRIRMRFTPKRTNRLA